MYKEFVDTALLQCVHENVCDGIARITTPFLFPEQQNIIVHISRERDFFRIFSDPLFDTADSVYLEDKAISSAIASEFGCSLGSDDVIWKICRADTIGRTVLIVAQCYAAIRWTIRERM